MCERNNEVAKEFLKGYAAVLLKIQSIELKLTELYYSQVGSAIKYSDMPKGHNLTDLSDYMSKRDELERAWQDEKMNSLKQLEKITQTISKLESCQQQQLLVLRYIKQFSWEAIMEPMHVSWATMHRIHGKALSSIYELIKDDIV